MVRTLIALVCVLALTGCATGTPNDTGAGFVAGSGVAAAAPEQRQAAPDVTGATLDGDELALADLDGPVVVNFWASWCGPCAQEAPDLAAVAQRYGPEGVHVVGVNIADGRANARSFERDFEIPYPSWYDESGQIAAAFGGVGPSALPTTILLDAQHRVAARMFGEVTAAQVSLRLESLLAEAGAEADAGAEGATS